MSGRLVAMTILTAPSDSNPSSWASSSISVRWISRSDELPSEKRDPPMASISSMKMTHGWWSLAYPNISRITRALSPMYLSTIADATTRGVTTRTENVTGVHVAAARAGRARARISAAAAAAVETATAVTVTDADDVYHIKRILKQRRLSSHVRRRRLAPLEIAYEVKTLSKELADKATAAMKSTSDEEFSEQLIKEMKKRGIFQSGGVKSDDVKASKSDDVMVRRVFFWCHGAEGGGKGEGRRVLFVAGV